MRSFLFATALALLVAHAASANPGKTPDVPTMVTDDCARARKANMTCQLNIDGLAIDGKIVTPNEDRIDILKMGQHGSLIRIRMDFIPEILKTAEDL